MRLPKNLFTGTYVKPKIFLCETDKQKMGILNTTDTHVSLKFNSYSELSFTIDRTYIDTFTGQKNTNLFYDRIEHPRLILLDNIGYFQIQAPDMTTDSFKESKNITAYSSEYALSQKYIADLHINTGKTDSVEVSYSEETGSDLEPVIFYNEDNPRLSLLHYALEGIYGWKINHVDDSLKTLVRSFDIDRQSVYDFLMNDVCEKYNCYIVFDTLENEINIYAEAKTAKFIGDNKTKTFTISPLFHKIETVSIDGYKTTQWEYDNKTGLLTLTQSKAPGIGSNIEVVDGGLTEWETNVFVTFENLAKEMQVSYNADDIITKLIVTYGDNQDISEINMGLPYITDLSYYYGAEYSVASVNKNTVGTYYIKVPAYREVYLPDDYNKFTEYYTLNKNTMKYSKMSNSESKKYVGTCYAYDGNHYKQVILPGEYKSSTVYYVKNNGWMGDDLYNAYSSYIARTQMSQNEYTSNSQEMVKLSAQKYYNEYRLSTEDSTEYSVATVDSSTIGIYYIKDRSNGGNFFKEVTLPDDYQANKTYYKLDYVNLNSEKVNKLYLAIRKNFMEHSIDDINELAGAFEFMEDSDSQYNPDIEYLSRNLSQYDSSNSYTEHEKLTKKKDYVMKFLAEMWEQVGRTPLKSLYQEIFKTIQSTNIEWAQEHKDPDGNVTYHENYPWYYAVLLFLESIDIAIAARETTINTIQATYDELQAKNIQLSNDLLMENNFTEDQLIRLSAFIKEDELHIDDIIETEYDTLEDSFKVKQDAMEAGIIELHKRSQPQLQFSMTMANIYAIPEFESIIHQFQLGKVIKIGLRKDYIKQARLLQVDMGLDDLSDFQVQFGELTGLRSQSDIHADLLSQAIQAGKSVASSQDNWNAGVDKAISTDLKIQQGLLDAATVLKSMDGDQGVEIDKYGIHLKKIDPDGNVDQKQGWITNNMMVYTDNNWTSSKSVFGEYKINGKDRWGLLADACIAGYIEGSTIVGGRLNIGNKNETTDKSEINREYNFSVDKNGNMLAQSAEIVGKITTSDITADGGTIGGFKITETYLAKDKTKYNDTKDGVYVGNDGIGLGQNKFHVTSAGKLTSTDADITGKITTKEIKATGGEIGGFKVTEKYIAKTKEAYNDTSSGVYLGTDGIGLGDQKFYVNTSGKLTAKDADIKGNITATSGYIGGTTGWTIGSTSIYNGKSSYSSSNSGIYIGTDGISIGTTAQYVKISKNGTIEANKATIKGNFETNSLKATGGTIGGWTIGENAIEGKYGSSRALISKSAIGVSGNVVFGVTNSSGKFTAYIDGTGTLYAQNAIIQGRVGYEDDVTIRGKIVATSGTIGGCEIKNGVLKVGSANIDSINANTITVNKITANQIEGLPASQITSGAFNDDRIPGLDCSKIKTGVFDEERIPKLSVDKLDTNSINGYRCGWQEITVVTGRDMSWEYIGWENSHVVCNLESTSYYKTLYLLVGVVDSWSSGD